MIWMLGKILKDQQVLKSILIFGFQKTSSDSEIETRETKSHLLLSPYLMTMSLNSDNLEYMRVVISGGENASQVRDDHSLLFKV